MAKSISGSWLFLSLSARVRWFLPDLNPGRHKGLKHQEQDWNLEQHMDSARSGRDWNLAGNMNLD